MFVTQLSRIISKGCHRRSSTTTTTITITPPTPTMTSTALVPLSTALQISASKASDALKGFITHYPPAGQDLAELSGRLGEILIDARLYVQNGAAFDADDENVPEILRTTLKDVVNNARALVDEEISDVLNAEGEERPRSWCEHVVERLQPVGRIAESTAKAMNLGVNLLDYIQTSRPSDSVADLPPYDHSQIAHEASNLKSRLVQDMDSSDDSRVWDHLPTLIDFVESVEEYMESNSPSSLTSSLPLRDSAGAQSSGAVSSMHSEAVGSEAPEVPDYNAIGITNPAPLSISVRHHVKKEIPNFEVFQISFFTRNKQPAIAISTLDVSTRFYDINVNQVSCLSHQHGVNMMFSPAGRVWAYLCESEPKDLNPLTHDGVHFKKPVVHLGDYMNGRRIQQMKWPGVKPLCFSPDGKWFVVGSSKGRLALLDVENGATLSKAVVIPCHLDDITHAVFTPDSALLVSQSRDGTIRLTDPLTRTSIAKLETDTWKKPSFLGVLPNNEVIVSIWGDTVFHWNYHSGSLETYSLSARRNREGWPIAISQDCRFLCCRTDDGVDLSDLHSGRVLYTIKFQRGYATTAAFSVDGKYLVLGKATFSMGIRVTVSTVDVWELIF